MRTLIPQSHKTQAATTGSIGYDFFMDDDDDDDYGDDDDDDDDDSRLRQLQQLQVEQSRQ